eukprot:CAMPEP_0117441420 /NCGR_PEP_ID=MMETSP0759-20121206/3626_1 /TAXON_ID=63605 /ORGANISM="Percolomonas cosmopolitus, Strain WS" /LENGTH=759 /DNA_ID=CAMNT_0005233275 /DNA_START=1 /DNA_END=2280 /DNA_ORIENTATION=+
MHLISLCSHHRPSHPSVTTHKNEVSIRSQSFSRRTLKNGGVETGPSKVIVVSTNEGKSRRSRASSSYHPVEQDNMSTTLQRGEQSHPNASPAGNLQQNPQNRNSSSSPSHFLHTNNYRNFLLHQYNGDAVKAALGSSDHNPSSPPNHHLSSPHLFSQRDFETRQRIRMQQQRAFQRNAATTRENERLRYEQQRGGIGNAPQDAFHQQQEFQLDNVRMRKERFLQQRMGRIQQPRSGAKINAALMGSPHRQYESEPPSSLNTGESPLRLQALLKTAADVDEWIAQPPVRPMSGSGSRGLPQPLGQRRLVSAPASQQVHSGFGTDDSFDSMSSPPHRRQTKSRRKRAESALITSTRRNRRKKSVSDPVSARFMREQASIESEYKAVLADRRRRKEHMKQVQELYTTKRKQKLMDSMQLQTPEDQKKVMVEHVKRDKALQEQLDRENQLIEKYRYTLSKHLGMHNFGWQRYESKKLLKEHVEDYDHWEKRNVEEFLKLDTNQDGYIAHDDLRSSLNRAYSRMDPDEIEEILHYRPDVNAPVNLEEFLFIKRQKEEDMEALFNEIDRNNDEEIDASELQNWLNTQPGLFEENAVDIIYNHTNNFSSKMNLQEFKLLHGMGSKQEFAEFEKKHELHLQLSEFFYGKHGRKESEESRNEIENISDSDLRKKTFKRKKEKKHPQTFFRLKTRPTFSEIEKLKKQEDEDNSLKEKEAPQDLSTIFRGIKKLRPRTAPVGGKRRGASSTHRRSSTMSSSKGGRPITAA